MTGRAEELGERLALVRAGIAEACRASGRATDSVTLIAVSKTWPVSDIEIMHGLGVRDFGENRAEELRAKASQLPGLGIRWHFLGQIQSKKARAIGLDATAVHSLDRARIIDGLAAGAADAGSALRVLIQVSLAGLAPAGEAAGRGGAQPQDVVGLADAVAGTPMLELAGLMALPPRSADPSAAFARLAEISADLTARHRGATWLSAGMSHDFGAAVRAGATHVRIGSGLFGERSIVR